MERVLFICGRNSGRSLIAEAYMEQMGADRFEVKSAGLEPAESANPLVVEVMKEEGLDLSRKIPQSAFDLFKKGELFTHVITVCDAETDANCPVFPGITKRLNWPFDNPEDARGSAQEKLEQVRNIRDRIKQAITNFLA